MSVRIRLLPPLASYMLGTSLLALPSRSLMNSFPWMYINLSQSALHCAMYIVRRSRWFSLICLSGLEYLSYMRGKQLMLARQWWWYFGISLPRLWVFCHAIQSFFFVFFLIISYSVQSQLRTMLGLLVWNISNVSLFVSINGTKQNLISLIRAGQVFVLVPNGQVPVSLQDIDQYSSCTADGFNVLHNNIGHALN